MTLLHSLQPIDYTAIKALSVMKEAWWMGQMCPLPVADKALRKAGRER